MTTEAKKDNQVKSRHRVTEHGEVFTSEREVNAMLDLVKSETERIDSRFLEPACGTGNFLAAILNRKLAVVESRYRKSQLEWERVAVIAVSSIYGVDILQDNICECIERLFLIFDTLYTQRFKGNCKEDCRKSVRFILNRNILWGDALSLTTPGDKPTPIIFSEWSAVNGSMLKRRDFMLSFLLDKHHQLDLFSDEGCQANIPEPVKEFPLIHFLNLADDTDKLQS